MLDKISRYILTSQTEKTCSVKFRKSIWNENFYLKIVINIIRIVVYLND